MEHRRQFLGAVLLAIVLFVSPTVAQWNDEEEQKDCKTKGSCVTFTVETTIPGCQCSDLVPSFYAGSQVNGTCLGQVMQGNCDKPFMQMTSTAEINDGSCDISCGRCKCCQTYAEKLTALGSTTFLQMAYAAGLKANLTSPAYSFTVLAPPNAAVQAYLTTAGLTAAQTLANVPLMQKIVGYHILPNVPVIDAWWSTPFFLPGTVLSTLLGPKATITIAPTGTLNGKVKAVGPDSPTCKGNVIPISAVLMPPTAVAAGKMPLEDPTPAATAAAPTQRLTPAPAVAQRAINAPQVNLQIGSIPAYQQPDGLRRDPITADSAGKVAGRK